MHLALFLLAFLLNPQLAQARLDEASLVQTIDLANSHHSPQIETSLSFDAAKLQNREATVKYVDLLLSGRDLAQPSLLDADQTSLNAK